MHLANTVLALYSVRALPPPSQSRTWLANAEDTRQYWALVGSAVPTPRFDTSANAKATLSHRMLLMCSAPYSIMLATCMRLQPLFCPGSQSGYGGARIAAAGHWLEVGVDTEWHTHDMNGLADPGTLLDGAPNHLWDGRIAVTAWLGILYLARAI